MLRRICRKPVFLRLSSNFNGPGLGDFIQGDVEEKTWSEYKVRLTRCRPKKSSLAQLGLEVIMVHLRNKSYLSRIREPHRYLFQ